MEKKVTIVIPNYNGLNYMEECFAALENQTCRDFQTEYRLFHFEGTVRPKKEAPDFPENPGKK